MRACIVQEMMVFELQNVAKYVYQYTVYSLNYGTNFDSLFKNPNITFTRISKCPKMLRYRDIESLNI